MRMKKGSYTLRHPVVSGLFYPDQAGELESMIDSYLAEIDTEALYSDIRSQTEIPDPEQKVPVVLVAPHAGFIFSGKVQAYSYILLKRRKVDTAIIIGPSHHKRFKGVSVDLDDAYSTPLGVSKIDREFSERLKAECSAIVEDDKAHLSEHVIEVQLPFLQRLYPEVSIVSLLFGEQDRDTVETLYRALAGTMNKVKRSYVVIASSDLSHYHSAADAARLDGNAIRGIKSMDPEEFYADIASGKAEACGAGAVMTGILLAKERGLGRSAVLCHTDSGVMSGDRRRVVGYVSAAMY